ncbi:serine/threonine-protein kinase [Sorangium sp. So ce295]|uniref:serine/threonine-protein kinase n=1 Tax=Sorangium sp. So ce295 TaxID=3133295 RepID=UPI003F648F2A
MVDRYELGDPLGVGGQALVRKARDRILERAVAIKSLEPFFGEAPADRDLDRLRREAKALAALSHPYIPAIYDIELDLTPRIIFEFIEGRNLLTVLNESRPSLREITRWTSQIFSALAHAHSRDILHRDIKPANIVLRDDGACCLVDFGFALMAGHTINSSSRAHGTVGYMSPEQSRGEPIDGRADIYSIAATIYHLLSNKLPKPEAYEPLSEIDESIPPALDTLLRRSLGPIKERPATIQEFAEAFMTAQHVRTSVAEILASGQLHEVAGLLQSMTPQDFAKLKFGQRSILFVRLAGVLSANSPPVIRAALTLLLALTRLSAGMPSDDFRMTIRAALKLGFDHQFGESWRGDPDLREEIYRAVLMLPSDHHHVMTEEVLAWAAGLNGNSEHVREPWYQGSAKRIIQLMTASDHCSDEDAAGLIALLRRLS